MIPTLISTSTITGNSANSIEITSGIDNTYFHHMFVITGCSPANVHKYFYWQWGTSYNLGWSAAQLTNGQKDNGTTGQSQGGGRIWPASLGTTRDFPYQGSYHDSSAGVVQSITHCYNWAGTVYSKRFRTSAKSFSAYDHRQEGVAHQAGYIQTQAAVTRVKWKWTDSHTTGNGNTGIDNMDIVVQLYGIE
jgi:hypothetical protein